MGIKRKKSAQEQEAPKSRKRRRVTLKPSLDLAERGTQSCAEGALTPAAKPKKERLVKSTTKKRRRRSKKKKARKRRKAGEKVSVTAHQRKNLDRVFQFALTKGFTEENWKNVARSIRT